MKKLFTVLLVGLLASCSMEDVCGEVTDYYEDCNVAGFQDCIYYLEIDGQRESVTYSTFVEARLGDYICIGY